MGVSDHHDVEMTGLQMLHKLLGPGDANEYRARGQL